MSFLIIITLLIDNVILIMADMAAEAKLRFLHASAHLYSITAPATSAQLMLQRQIDGAGDPKPKSIDGSSSACKACGTVLIPGWTSNTSRIDKRASKVANSKSPAEKHARGKLSPISEKHVRVKCLACHRFEYTPLQKSKTSSNSEKANATSRATRSSDAKPNQDPEASHLPKASKRRERARKHKGGLQAMLEKSKAPTAPSGFGLELLDLMKQD